MTTTLTDAEYEAALAELADYERRITESDRLAQRDSLKVAETLDRLFHDQHWIEERNAQRTITAKTPRGGRPVDPESRSQFSTWVRERYNRFEPRRTYQLLDAYWIRSSFLNRVQITPVSEKQVRPLKSLLSVANGRGERIPEVWDLACKLAADDGRDQPTEEHVKHARDEWKRIHLPQSQQREPGARKTPAERADDLAWLRERQAEAAWKALFQVGGDEQINTFLSVVRADVEAWQAQHAS